MPDPDDKKYVDEPTGKEGDAADGSTGTIGDAATPTPNFATKEDIAEIKGAMEQITLSMKDFGQPQPIAPPTPVGPTIEDQISKIDEQLVKLDTAMDDAITKGEPVSNIQRRREELIQTKTDIKYDTKIQEIQTMGTFAISQLTDKVVAKDMPMLKYPEVKAAYEEALASMSPAQKMNPEVCMTAYNYARGTNQDIIFDKMFEEHIRKAAEEDAATQVPTDKSGRNIATDDDPNRIPEPSEYLSADNLKAIEVAGKTVDSYYKSLGQGYEGWDDFWVKTGKAHFVGEEEKPDE